jgi:hypothetical protein
MNEVGLAQAVIGSFIIRLADVFEIAVAQAANGAARYAAGGVGSPRSLAAAVLHVAE